MFFFPATLRGGEANLNIRAPDSLKHRYYVEDFGYGLAPFVALAKIASVDVPIASSLLRLGAGLVEENPHENGRTAERMGIAGVNRRELLAMVRQDTGVNP